ncbi:MAG: patatin-like phospholipase family protein [Chitinophagaceae bacterium]|nr:MAG: patatin-like phospholipase family protein [Chitinophagaceae bacterium]
MSKALVISGGGSKGAFAVGVIKYLAANFPMSKFDMYVGTSTGSLIAPLAALDKIDELEELYTTQNTKDIVQKFNIGDRLSKNSIMGVDPLWKLVNKHYTDDFYEKLQQSGKQIFLATTCLQTSELVIYSNKPQAASDNYASRQIETPMQFRKAVLASACQPVFMPPVKVNLDFDGAEDQFYQYVDGGVREYAGIEMAIQNGATEIVAILLSAEHTAVELTEYKDIYGILEKTISIFTEDVGKNDMVIPMQFNEALKYIDSVKRKMRKAGLTKEEVDEYFTTSTTPNPFQDKVPLKIHIVRPQKPLGGGPGGLDFVPGDMTVMLSTGEEIMQEYIAKLEAEGSSWV